MNKTTVLTLAISALCVASCDNAMDTVDRATAVQTSGSRIASVVDEPQTRDVDPGNETADPIDSAIAVLHPTRGNETHGVVRFTESGNGGLKVESRFRDLPGEEHAYHVHLLGDCSAADGTSAGTHFNFRGSSKDPAASIDRITGNLGEISVDESGQVTHSTIIEEATLSGDYSIIGRSVIVHAQGNDPDSPPIGAAGSRLACGVIGVAGA